MTHFKVGDLAIIVKDDGFQENLGITVQIVGQAGYIAWYPYSLCLKRSYKRPRRLYSWSVVALSSRGICYRDSKDELFFSCSGEVPDSCLQRLPKISVSNEVFAVVGIKSGVLCEAERIKELLQEAQNKSYDPIESAMKDNPTLTRELAVAMAKEFGF
jgi:hypothetical protein